MTQEATKIHAPDLVGGYWVNSEPLTIASLRSKAVLIDFWDYTCVNCIRTLPYVKEWHRRYAVHGLHVIGGLLAFIFLLIRTKLSKFTPAQATAAIVVSYYWHFVDVVWIALFSVIYFIR